jgi:hypothetical protein
MNYRFATHFVSRVQSTQKSDPRGGLWQEVYECDGTETRRDRKQKGDSIYQRFIPISLHRQFSFCRLSTLFG